MNDLSFGVRERPNSLLALAMFIGGVLGTSLIIGLLNEPGPWYASLEKPPFNPPNWLFGPVWTLLYVLIGIAGWRIWRTAPRSPAMWLWVAQLLLNWIWSPAFFGLESPWLALLIILALLFAILRFSQQSRNYDRIAALLFVPYGLWVGFAAILNGWIAFAN